jgi:hypothetical protein
LTAKVDDRWSEIAGGSRIFRDRLLLTAFQGNRAARAKDQDQISCKKDNQETRPSDEEKSVTQPEEKDIPCAQERFVFELIQNDKAQYRPDSYQRHVRDQSQGWPMKNAYAVLISPTLNV